MATPIQNRATRVSPQAPESPGIFKRITTTLGQLFGLSETSQTKMVYSNAFHKDDFLAKTPYPVAAPRGLQKVSQGHVSQNKPSDSQMLDFLDQVRKPAIRVS